MFQPRNDLISIWKYSFYICVRGRKHTNWKGTCFVPCKLLIWPYGCVRRVYASQFLSHHNKDLEWRTLKPPWRVTALGSWTDRVIPLRSWTDRVIALRQISVTALFYLEDSRKIHLRGVRARRSKDAKRRAPHLVGGGEREREHFGSSFYVLFLPPGPAVCKLGLARSAVLPEVLTLVLGPSFEPSSVLFLRAFPFLVF